MTSRTLEISLRRAAGRQGLFLSKSRRRDPLAIGFGYWQLLDRKGGAPVFGSDVDGLPCATLDEVKAFLTAARRASDV